MQALDTTKVSPKAHFSILRKISVTQLFTLLEVFYMKKGLKKLIAVASAISMLGATAGALAACQKDGGGDPWGDGSLYNDFKIGGTVKLGNTTEMGGDFRWTGLGQSSANAADQDIMAMTSGYSTMELNKGGNYVWNQTVVKSHSAEEVDDGAGGKNYKVTIEINPGLKMSDGTEVKAANYLVYPLAMSTAVSREGLSYYRSGYSYVGYWDYLAYDGTNDGATVGDVTASKAFAGFRLLGDYKFSMEITSDNYPYYYVSTLAAISPYDTKLFFGNDNLTIKDDGQGAYIDGWFAKAGDKYKYGEHMKTARYDITTYAYTGPYKVSSFDTSTKIATLTINENYAGNFEGQKPHIQTITYSYIAQASQANAITSGQIDVLAGVTGGTDTKNMLNAVSASDGKLAEVHYDRAGYGKVHFCADAGPTMFAEVRQAVAYCLDRNEFAQTFTGGYGTVVNGPYANCFDAYAANEEGIEALNSYAKSVASAKRVLEEGGWVYNADGTTYSGSGVRYKKLTAAEATDDNKAFTSVSSSTVYKTEKIGDDYYMPCVINWFGTDGNEVTEMLNARLVQGSDVTSAGMLITATTGTFTKLQDEMARDGASYGGSPTYGMFNLATGWNSSIYDRSYEWMNDPDFMPYNGNRLNDPYDDAFPYYAGRVTGAAHTKRTYEEAVAASNGKLGLDYISFAMVFDVDPDDTESYNKWWMEYMKRWNELLPDIPLYSNIYYDIYNSNILNFKTSPFWGVRYALLYCGWKPAQD